MKRQLANVLQVMCHNLCKYY